MAYDFKGKNKLKTKELFEARKKYRDEALFKVEEDRFHAGVQDYFLGTDLSFYGRADEERNFLSLMPGRARYFSSKHKDPAKAGSGPRAADFVVDAFEKFMGEFERLLNENICGVTAEDIDLRVVSAWQPYKAVQNLAYRNIALYLADDLFLPTENEDESRRRNNLETIEQFLKRALKFAKKNVGQVPITGTSVISSKYCSVASSGLAIVLKDFKKDDDVKKAEFMNGKVFDFYRQAAMQHGFMVNRNAPYQIVANIDSPAMQEYMKERLTDGTREGLWESHYTKLRDTDMDELIKFMLSMWNGISARIPHCTKREKTCSGNGTRPVFTRRV